MPLMIDDELYDPTFGGHGLSDISTTQIPDLSIVVSTSSYRHFKPQLKHILMIAIV